MIDLLNTFSTALAAEGKSKNTIRNYLMAARQLLRAHKNNLNKINQESLDIFYSGFNARNGTQNFKKNAINKFLAFLYARKRLKKPFQAHIKSIAMSEPAFLTIAEQNRFFEVLRASPKRIRDYTLFSVMLYTGMRISEVLNLKIKDYQDEHLIIHDSKTGPGKPFVRKKLVTIIENYLEELQDVQNLTRQDYIFQSGRYHQLTQRWAEKIIKKYLRLAGIQKVITPHSLRHTFAANLIKSSGNITIVQRALRHKHITSTMRYAHIADKEVESAIERSVKMSGKSKKRLT
jgi:integrase/recombinase XerD